MDDLRLLALKAATVFNLTEAGRIGPAARPGDGPGPRLRIAGCPAGNLVWLRHDVGTSAAQVIERHQPWRRRLP